MIRLAPVLMVSLAAISLSACAGLTGHRKDTPIAAAPQPAPAAQTPAPETPAPRPVMAPPQARACVPRTLSPPPRYPDSDLALRDAAGAADRYQLMAAGRLMRQKRLEELERIVAGCR